MYNLKYKTEYQLVKVFLKVEIVKSEIAAATDFKRWSWDFDRIKNFKNRLQKMRFGLYFCQIGVKTEIKLSKSFRFWKKNCVDKLLISRNHAFTSVSDSQI